MTGPLFAEISALLEPGAAGFGLAVLVFLRAGAMLAFLPAVGEMILPLRLRLAACLVFTLVVLPALAARLPQDPVALSPVTGAAEVLAGLMLGLMLRLMIFALQIAGSIIAHAVSLSQMFAGSGPEPQPIFANLLALAGIALFCLSDGLARSAELLLRSYELLGPGQWPVPGEVTRHAIAQISRIFALGFTLSAPFMIAALLYNLTLGAINRSMPGLMVTFIGAPALTFGGLLLLALIAPFLLKAWHIAMMRALSAPFGGG